MRRLWIGGENEGKRLRRPQPAAQLLPLFAPTFIRLVVEDRLPEIVAQVGRGVEKNEDSLLLNA